jgi:di/tricarboxylate transporter
VNAPIVLLIIEHVKRMTIIALLYLFVLLLQGFYNLKMVPANNFNATILFLVGGLAPNFLGNTHHKKLGRIWDCIGIAETIAFITIRAITRRPENPITERRGGPIAKLQSL